MATHSDAKIRYYVSNMILNVHSDASYLMVTNGRSQAGGYYFLGDLPIDRKPTL